MKKFAFIMTALVAFLLLSGPAAAAEFTYAPKDCDFRMTFPEEPAKGIACDASNPKDCHPVNTYTKIFDVSTGLRINVTCGPAEKNMLQKYSGQVMQYTLAAMSKDHIDTEAAQSTFQDLGTAKQALLMGSKKHEDGSETIYMSQLWIGTKSVMTVEGEVTGEPLPEADTLFAGIMKSVALQTTPAPKAESAAPNNAKAPEKPQEKAPAKTPEKAEKP